MAMKKTTKPVNPAASNPAGKNAIKISSAVTVLGKALLPGLSPSMTPRQPFSNAELARLTKLANAIKAMEAKAAADKKANAKIIKKQNKTPLNVGRGPNKSALAPGAQKKKVVEVKVKRTFTGRGGGGGGMLGAGGGLPDYNR